MKELTHEIKGMIGGVSVQQSEIMAKQKMVDVTKDKVSSQGSDQKVLWRHSTKVEFLKFYGKDFDSWLIKVEYYLK